jgi:hypothetical protein
MSYKLQFVDDLMKEVAKYLWLIPAHVNDKLKFIGHWAKAHSPR